MCVCISFMQVKIKKDVIINADAMRLYREGLIDIGKAGMVFTGIDILVEN